MMKKILVIVLAALLCIPAFSQFNFGIKAGVTSTTVPSYNLISTGTNPITPFKTAAYGYQAGIFFRLTVAGIYIMPEAVFASTTYDYNVKDAQNVQTLLKQNFNKLEIPILLGFHLGPIRINAGPSASILINSPKDLIVDPNFKDLYRSATIGYQAGIGFDLLKILTFDARYGGSLSKKFGNSVNIGTQTFALDNREPTLMLSLGLMF